MDLVKTQQMEDWLYTGIIVLIAMIAGYITYRLTFAAVKRIISKVDDKGKAIIMRIRFPLAFFFLLISFFLIVPYSDTLISDSEHLGHISSLIVIFSISWLLIKIISVMKMLAVKKYDINTTDNLKARKAFTQYNILERVATFIIIVLAVGLALMTFDGIRKIGVSLLASAGIAGIILGFAAQRLIATVLAGLQLAITQPIRLDDVVIVENEWGWIEEITLTYVVVRIWDKRRLVLPTIYFIEKPFQNWTRTSADILGTVFIYADYQLPIDALREELKNILSQTDLWDGKVSVIQVTDATERCMQIRILVSASTSPRAWDLRVLIREKMITFIQKNYPHCLPRSRVELNPAGISEKAS